MVFVFNVSFEQFNVSLLNYFFKNLNSSEYAAKKKNAVPDFPFTDICNKPDGIEFYGPQFHSSALWDMLYSTQ